MEYKYFCDKKAGFWFAAVLFFAILVSFFLSDDAHAAERRLPGKNGGTVSISDEEAAEDFLLIPFRARADGYISAAFKSNTKQYNYSIGFAQLWNETKTKALSKIFEYNSNSVSKGFYTDSYGVKKGRTYYIAVLASGGVSVNVKFKPLKDPGGTKQKKAFTIPKGSRGVMGIIAAGTVTERWYKFTMTKNQKLNCEITPWCTGDVTFTIKGPGLIGEPSGTIRGRSRDAYYNYLGYWGKPYPLTTRKAIRSGTYYVSVRPAQRDTTGYYKITWK